MPSAIVNIKDKINQLLLLLSFCNLSGSINIFISNYYEWTPPKQNRTRLFCPDMCQDPILRSDRPESECCACRAKPEWEIFLYPVLTGDLSIEYVSRRNLAKVLNLYSEMQQYQLIHIGGVLSRLPDNICNFDKIIILNLEGNVLTEIGNISCLLRLDTLILKSNKGKRSK